MKLRQWLLGCLNSGIKRGAELAGTFLAAWTIGAYLDWKTLALSWSVGFTIGLFAFQIENPIPDDLIFEIPFRNLPKNSIPQPPPPQPLVDKIDL